MSTPANIAARMKVVTITTLVDPMTSFRVDQETFFISPSVAIRKSAVLGLLSIQNISHARATTINVGMPN